MKVGGENIEQVINQALEYCTVGSIYQKPDLFVEYGQYIRSKYDFADDSARFFYDSAEIIYKTRTQSISKTAVITYMAEDAERLANFKKCGGWKIIEEWMRISDADDFKNSFRILKKYSILREYQRNGFDVEKIIKHKKFELWSAEDIYRMIRAKADRVNTVILVNNDGEVLNENISNLIDDCMKTPDMGLQIPYPILNDLFRGIKTKTMMAVGMLSNAGKSRYMFKLIAYIALVKKEKVLVLLNEMSIEQMRYCLLTTVINNPEFQQLHGKHGNKPEREITLGLYRDDTTKNFLYQEKNDWGDCTETVEDYIKRVSKSSKEYKAIKEIAQWIEKETQGLIFAKDVSNSYDDKTLEFEIRKAAMVHSIKYVFYDTLKQDTDVMGEWAALKATTTKLSEVAKSNDVFIYASIQLSDDANYIKADELTSSQIANAKQIKHVLDTLLLCKEIPRDEFKKYAYLQTDKSWGEPVAVDLNPQKRYYIANVDKNRFGGKAKVVIDVNLDYNTWIELGEVVRK